MLRRAAQHAQHAHLGAATIRGYRIQERVLYGGCCFHAQAAAAGGVLPLLWYHHHSPHSTQYHSHRAPCAPHWQWLVVVQYAPVPVRPSHPRVPIRVFSRAGSPHCQHGWWIQQHGVVFGDGVWMVWRLGARGWGEAMACVVLGEGESGVVGLRASTSGTMTAECVVEVHTL